MAVFQKPHLPSAAVTFSWLGTEHFRQEERKYVGELCREKAVGEKATSILSWYSISFRQNNLQTLNGKSRDTDTEKNQGRIKALKKQRQDLNFNMVLVEKQRQKKERGKKWKIRQK